jgi:hypothetical protein
LSEENHGISYEFLSEKKIELGPFYNTP